MNKKDVNIEKKHNKHDRGEIFVKVTAGVLSILMVAGTVTTLIYALFQ